jgi:hypothetical protein
MWNDNDYLYEEKFKGEQYVIEPHGFIEMDLDDAHMMLGTYKPIVKNGQGIDDPRYFKMLRIESDQEPLAMRENPLLCHANGQVQPNAEALMATLAKFAHLKASDPEAEKAAKAEVDSMRDELAKNREELAEMKAMISKLLAKKGGKEE